MEDETVDMKNILRGLRPPGWQTGMPSPATTAREKAIAYARQVLTGSGDANVVNLASQYLRVLGLSS